MAGSGIVADPVFMKHDTGPGHPERRERLERIYSMLQEQGLWEAAEKIPLREASAEELLRVHAPGHLERVAATAGRDRSWMDGDTPTGADSYQAALLAAGSLLNATDAVCSDRLDNAFALVRPPGHHAEREQAMGFCLFNNVAVAAAHALDQHGMSRVLVIDWDVHHGNGTQHSFYSDPRLLYFSTHRYPFYPGTGYFDEIGSGPGRGYTVNVPLPAGSDDSVFDAVFARLLEPVARGFQPELILVSAGFDAHRRDPLGGMMVTEQGYARMAARVLALARELCGGKLVITLEGGYDLEGQAKSVAEVMMLMMGKKEAPPGDLEPPPGFEQIIDKEKQCLGELWPGLGHRR